MALVNPQESNLKRTNVVSSAKLTIVKSELKPTSASTKSGPTLVSSVVEGD